MCRVSELASPENNMFHFAKGNVGNDIAGKRGFSSSHLIGVEEECVFNKVFYDGFRILRNTISHGLPGLAYT